jgi:hypothetical protein
MSEERTYTIDGTTYKDSELSIRCKNVIVARAEIQQSKLRHELELEKIEVLTNYYNEQIKKEIPVKQELEESSKSKEK